MRSFEKNHGWVLRFVVISLGAILVLPSCGKEDEGASAGDAKAEAQELQKLPFKELVSFDALYRVSLREARGEDAFTSYDGMLILSWAHDCGGYRTDQKLAANITNGDNNFLLSEFSATSWEDEDQTGFQFLQVSKVNKQVVDEVAGRAKRDKWGDEGTITITRPEKSEHPLAKDAMYPTMLTAKLLQVAEEGMGRFEGFVYDGSDEYFKYRAVATIGKKEKDAGDPKAFPGADAISGMSYWPVQLSYYTEENPDGLPEFEISMNMYENGVGTNLVLDYGTFSVDGKLVDLKLHEEPKCDVSK